MLNQVLSLQNEVFANFQQTVHSLTGGLGQENNFTVQPDQLGEQMARGMIQKLALSNAQVMLGLIKVQPQPT